MTNSVILNAKYEVTTAIENSRKFYYYALDSYKRTIRRQSGQFTNQFNEKKFQHLAIKRKRSLTCRSKQDSEKTWEVPSSLGID